MAIFRQIQIDFWQDELVAEFTPEDKLFYLYLMTNSKTNACGVYRINKRIVAFDIGWNSETVEKMLNRFVGYGRIKYNPKENEIFILHWLKHNSAKSPKVAVRIDKDLVDVKTPEFHDEVVRLCIQYGYPIRTVCILNRTKTNTKTNTHTNTQTNTNTNTENEEPFEEDAPSEENKPVATSAINPFDFYQQHFGVMNPTVMQSVDYWIEDIGEELVIEAMRRAALDQKGYRYSEGIMRNWAKQNIKTLQDAEAQDIAFSNSRNKKQGVHPVRTEKLPDWAQEGYVPPETKSEWTSEKEEEFQKLARGE